MSDRLKARHLAVENVALSHVEAYDEAAVIRRADALRAEAMAQIAGRVGAAIRKVFARMIQSIEQAQSMRVLYQMDDDTLKDIGITRDQIPGYVIGLTRKKTDEPEPVYVTDAPRQAA